MKLLSRRSVLKASAGLALAAPRLGAAQSSGAPKRLLLLSHCHGWTADTWKMLPDVVGLRLQEGASSKARNQSAKQH